LEGEVWIGIAFAKEYLVMLSFMIDTQESWLAEPLVKRTEERLRKRSWHIWVSDGINAYREVFRDRHCILKTYPRTRKKASAPSSQTRCLCKVALCSGVKERDRGHRVIWVFKRCRYEDIPLHKSITFLILYITSSITY
jgi:IS1 family transposase